MINLLYSAIVGGHDITQDWYAKKHAAVRLSKKAEELRAGMLQGIPDDKVALAACLITDWARYTVFWSEISSLDAENTYADTPGHAGITAREVLQPVSGLRRLYTYLDKDIIDRLVCPSWFDVMAACGLQLLRSVCNG